ncbi:hypothetical protein [Rhodopseudomonas sp. P2A-2r]|uniref:hypothetical protein n=1 Tax=unclassified Rhodopseudomonas TaxID=2638247 RepID=UPI0022349634|nr:hypothetical protein [Rhodopseudomonas sp. P2A-2r]UZE47178.1 hypothetical protein ONR75_19560 [Rhodopseudomonas sp. P2A-2r]
MLLGGAAVAEARPVAAARPDSTQQGPAVAAAAKKSAEALQAYLERVEKAGRRPDYTSPPASDLWQALFDVDRLAALPPFAAGDVEWLSTWGEAANYTIIRVMWFGVQSKSSVDEAAFRRNVMDYEDQYAAATNFLIRIAARQSAALMQQMEQLAPEQRTATWMEGFELSRIGAGEMVRGLLISVAQGMKPANARMMTAALKDTREIWSGYLSAEQRAEALSIIEQAAYFRDEQVKGNIASFATAIRTAI